MSVRATFTFGDLGGPGNATAISCQVDYVENEGMYLAESAHGFRGAAATPEHAALACFTAWCGGPIGWYVAQTEEDE